MEVITLPAEFTSFLHECMSSFKCSAHDIFHVNRVASLALKLAATETNINSKLVYVAALCHDILDSKLLAQSESMDMEQRLRQHLLSFLSLEECDSVLDIVKSVGYRKLLSKDFNIDSKSVEYKCVQDADLLDAIGSIGVGRCYSFGGGRNRNLFNLGNLQKVESMEDYVNHSENSSNLQHFFDKLLRIKTMMLTIEGRRLAVARHTAMVSFMQALSVELIDAGSEDGYILEKLLQQEAITA